MSSPTKRTTPSKIAVEFTPKREQSAFKSPRATKNSAFKAVIHNNRDNGAGAVGGKTSIDFWEVSPICTRLQEHVALLGGNCVRDRLFLQSPMTNQMMHPFASPFLDSK